MKFQKNGFKLFKDAVSKHKKKFKVKIKKQDREYFTKVDQMINKLFVRKFR
jgi:hypothetical protein